MATPEEERAIQNMKLASRIGRKLLSIMANMADLMGKISELQAGQTESLKDVQRLIQQGDTQGAVDAVQGLIDQNTQLDAAVEAASPEPTEPPAP
jgi:hypothetical protein